MLDENICNADEIPWAEKYLGTKEIKVEKKTFHDRQFSSRGWQHRNNGGNSTVGRISYDTYCKIYEVLEDSSKCARNDSDPRFFVKKIFRIDDKSIVKVSNDPSRSGKSCTWHFVYINAKE